MQNPIPDVYISTSVSQDGYAFPTLTRSFDHALHYSNHMIDKDWIKACYISPAFYDCCIDTYNAKELAIFALEKA